MVVIVIIILLQECASFYFWSTAEILRMQGLAGFCSLVAIFHDLEHPTFANLWKSCHIPALFSISFSVFLSLSYQLLSVMPLLDPFLHPFFPHAPTIALLLSQKLFQSLYTRHFTNLLIVHFIFEGFSTYHSEHSEFCGRHLPFSMPSIQHQCFFRI